MAITYNRPKIETQYKVDAVTEWIKNKKTVVFERAIETLTFVVGLVVYPTPVNAPYLPRNPSNREIEVERETVVVLFNRNLLTVQFDYPTLENFSRRLETVVFEVEKI